MMRSSIMRLYSALMRALSSAAMVSGMVRIGDQKMLSSAVGLITASSCGNTFSIRSRGCTTPAFMPWRMLSMAWSNNSGMPSERRDQVS